MSILRRCLRGVLSKWLWLPENLKVINMKKSIFILVLIFCQILLIAQRDYRAKSDCESFNRFLRTEKLAELKSISDTIYPSGKIIIDPEKFEDVKDIVNLYPLLELSPDMSFELVKETYSRFQDNLLFRRFQQYYKGVVVEGGGYTASYMVISTGGPGGPAGPCDELYTLAPYLFTDIDIDVSPVISESQITSILEVKEINNANLVIEQNLEGLCEYTLVWKADYFSSRPITSWINAKNGEILKTIESTMFKNAPTEDYGIQNMDDSNQANLTRLVTQDGSITTYDFAQENLYNFFDPVDYTEELIPTSNSFDEWTILNAPENVYQAHWVTTDVRNFYQTLGINFEVLHVAANCSNIWFGTEQPNAYALIESTLELGYIAIGESGGSTLAEFDIIGHELGHVFINDFLDYDEGGNASLHEGIADMLGVYIEMIQNGGTFDWVMGDDIPMNIRDLENPEFDCFDNVENLGFDDRHRRSTPLGHWFYLASDGGSPNIDVLSTLNILLEALNDISRDSDYEDLMNATLTVVEENFGICSEEFAAINNAWETICVETGFGILNTQPCSYSISGPTSVCEESEYAKFCISGGIPDAHYRWTIIGRKSTEYESTCGMQGNTQEGCDCLTLIDFPKYPYYSQYITIEVYSPTVGSEYKVKKRVKLRDCNGDDPTCKEYYNSNPGEGLVINHFNSNLDSFNSSFCRVYDLYGNLIYSGDKMNLHEYLSYKDGIIFIVNYDEKGVFINTEKQVILR